MTRFSAPRHEDFGKYRKRTLAAIHAAAKKLGMDDDTYRALILRVSEQAGAVAVDSAGKCDRAQLAAVADELRRLGGMSAPARKPGDERKWKHRPKHPALTRAELVAKVEAMLADAGRPWDYAHAMAQRICKVERIDFCTPAMLGKIIAALTYDADRRYTRQVLAQAGSPADP